MVSIGYYIGCEDRIPQRELCSSHLFIPATASPHVSGRTGEEQAGQEGCLPASCLCQEGCLPASCLWTKSCQEWTEDYHCVSIGDYHGGVNW